MKNIIEVQHAEWLQHPVTCLVKQIVDKQENRLIDLIASASSDESVTDAHIRRLAVQLKTIKTTKKIIHETPTFIPKS